ncbi:hypothetical protein BZB76_5301 [Actinomadura pelletieri DSM 43383]|uniref:Uncharacterized protein n=1 Tax=Actinomadura pelletieri DSM 43383 TaxID=1120940 RepID=A0A495QGH6_9ACTN|nr:hypothetical protein [Actinomadura pelletieri]RKS70821.1 hypothetical protein BZB76_5301 [Actinomadura pelletieri DSM 43383]
MRFKGVHRKPREPRHREWPRAGRSRGDGRPGGDAYAPSPPDSGQVRPRSNQPRDRFGRFRKAGRDDDFALGPGGAPDDRAGRDGPDTGDTAGDPPGGFTGRFGRRRRGRPRQGDYSWSDFELEDDRLRVEPYPPGTPHVADGRRHCGVLENVLYRQWDVREGPPSPEVIAAVDSLASLPEPLKEKLAAGLDGIYVGPGGVPQLDDMGHLRDRPLPSGRATWDICAGAYGDHKIIVGDRPSPTPDVMLHEVGHALDDLDGEGDEWASDSPAFQRLYEECLPHLASAFHRQPNTLGRREFFADAFAAISSRQRPALVDMLAGNIRLALEVMLFFNRGFGI